MEIRGVVWKLGCIGQHAEPLAIELDRPVKMEWN